MRPPVLLSDIERSVRWVIRALPVAVPVLLLAGLGLGHVLGGCLGIPGGAVARSGERGSVIRIDGLSRYMTALRDDGRRTLAFVSTYERRVRPIELSLRRRGLSPSLARSVAWPLVQNASARGLDPATVLAVTLVESDGHPDATSRVGARGLMQVMPLHGGSWNGCGDDLYDIRDNLCNGTSILAWYLRQSGYNERLALLGYNGCVTSANTPDCTEYPDRVQSERRRLLREWSRLHRDTAVVTGGLATAGGAQR
jgi:Transglycosylase SLT domain